MAGFAAPWREVGALLSLGALFVAALPYVTAEDFTGSILLIAVLVASGLAVVAAAALATGNTRLEPTMALAIAVVGVLLVLWEFGSDFDIDEQVGAAGWAHAAFGVIAYVAAAAWFAVLGVLRDSRRLTFAATAALVLFTTVQAFSVFAAIVQGAWLFVLLGLVFVGTGWLAYRARRQLARLPDDPRRRGRRRPMRQSWCGSGSSPWSSSPWSAWPWRRGSRPGSQAMSTASASPPSTRSTRSAARTST